MRAFTDNKGVEHKVSFSVGTMRKVKAELDIDLTKLTEQNAIELMQDVSACVDILHIATETELDADEFAGRLGGDSCENGIHAMFEAIADFFPKHRRGAMQAATSKAFIPS